MREGADLLAGGFVVDDTLSGEFEARLVESSTLAFRVAFSVLRHREDAEDVAQEAFVRAHGSFAKLRDREAFRAWLVRTTWRLALDRLRGDRRRARREDAEAPPPDAAGESVHDALAARERAAHVWRAIDELPEKMRLVVVLASMEGHDLTEVSRLLDVPEGTVKSRLFNARRQLRERLQWLNTTTTTR